MVKIIFEVNAISTVTFFRLVHFNTSSTAFGAPLMQSPLAAQNHKKIIIIIIITYRDNKVCGNCMFSTTVDFSSQLDIRGLAAARIEARAFREQIIPAFAIDRVCCS